ncbi:hypothetical protein, conserved [Plasmodium gonderi]|uniref:U6 snRNA phosphodiesterase 1 n=1 Tax=Plasmodium gonderi TaxID=77519 RepID=A0A1Y1JIS9_PLAGO|nr:hypothetical protein, conserved [Plasmodium gonderi]GAW82130.1 hypothetical protein, conserved [Plasmodium gonderi]
MLNIGNFNSYIYIPVKINESIRTKSQVCFDILQKLVEKNLAIITDKESPASPYRNQKDELDTRDLSNHVFYQLEKLNKFKNKKKGDGRQKEFNDPLHITIAGPVQIKRHMISSFVRKISEELETQSCFYLFFKNGVDLYKSQKYTKYFCAYSVIPEQQEAHLDILLKKINKILSQFGLINNYDNRICHMSLAYTNINLEPVLQESKLNIDSTFWSNIHEAVEDMHLHTCAEDGEFFIYVNRICVRVGNTVYESPFKAPQGDMDILQSDESYDSSTD